MYWKPGKPYVDEVRFDYIADDNTRILKIKSGEADLVEGIPFSQIKDLQGSSGFKLQVQPIARLEAIFPNDSKPPFNDLRVRQALNYATDKNAINQALYGGVAQATHSMLPKMRYYDPSVPGYEANLAKAKELLKASPVPSGFSATLIYPAGSSLHQQLATILQAEWAQIGVKLTVEGVEGGALFSRYLAGDYDLAMPLVQWTSDVTVPDETGLQIWTNDKANVFRAAGTRWTVPQQLVSLSEQAARAKSDAARKNLWQRVQRLAMAQAPWIPLFTLPSVTAVANDVQGFRTLPAAWWDLENVWLKK